MTEIITAFADISHRYDAVFCDVWGCFHNGVAPLPGAIAALQAYRAAGGKVILLTNAPRPEASVAAQLDRMQAPTDAWDAIASSGGAARAAVQRGDWGKRVYHIGDPDRDEGFFEDTDIERVALDEAETIVCTGLRNDRTETLADYEDELTEGAIRRLRFLCANPDLVVDVGTERRLCAGSLAQLYRDKGGEVTEYGKPHAQIYDYARSVLTGVAGREIADNRILCIGDGIITDIKGAVGEDLDSLFITAGLAAAELNGADGAPDPGKLAAFVERHMMTPTAAMGLLA
ncbi:MAG: TIGR01459 family HAD-type hydrolase [Pseudomonadota bacterium]